MTESMQPKWHRESRDCGKPTLQELVSGLGKRPCQSQSFPVLNLVQVVLRENSPNWLSNGIQEQWLLPSFLLDPIR